MADYKVIKDFGVIADHDGIQLKLQLISWYGNKAKYDLRPWKGDYGMKGMVFEESSLKNLKSILNEFYKTHKYEPKKVVENQIVHSLTCLPAGDCSYQTTLREATKDDLRQAIEQMKDKPGNKTRISLCEKALKSTGKRGRPKKVAEVVNQPVTKAEEPKKEKVIQFPTEKPKIIQLPKSNDTHSYEECEQKLNKERAIFKDQDSAYVIDGILELCKVDADFRNNVMRKDKSYGGAFEYFAKKAREGYCVKYGEMSYLDNDLALGLAIDYFNADSERMDAEEKRKREEEAAKRKAEAEAGKKNAKTNGKKKSRTA